MRHLLLACLILLAAGLSHARAESSLTGVMLPFRGPTNYEIEALGLVVPDAETKNGDLDTDLRVFDLGFRARFGDNPDTVPTMRIGLHTFAIDSIDPALPESAGDLFFSGGINHVLNETFTLSWGLGIGYAGELRDSDGDWSFDGGDQGIYGSAGIGLTQKIDEFSSITYLIDWDGNRSIFPDIPLPGIAYTKRLQTETPFMFTVGFPFATVRWTPVDKLNLDATFFYPESFRARIGYRVIEPLEFYGELLARNKAYAIGSLPKDRRLFFRQDLLEAGLKWRFLRGLELTVAGGWAFGQQFTTGYDVRDDTTVRKLSDAPYARLGFGMKF
ncbi:hypothetical protein [Mucisphaera calidilacus]|uniref:Uncharacterized protein n=1 Tax=Mucisphaera calidilacus TaxID=2527982 RepID=A0A518C0B6_9BACT|nr:hypothetical protein [Mucisphaera calidilacus]QDU72666.1 hypothetical protein Pan265_25390 [Mucisphaera calidilacus]